MPERKVKNRTDVSFCWGLGLGFEVWGSGFGLRIQDFVGFQRSLHETDAPQLA